MDRKEIAKLVDQIAREFKPQKIILFGSHAYGKPGKDSDVDLLIIMETDERPADRIVAIARLFRDRTVPMDFIVKTPKEIGERLEMGDFFIKRILEEGITLYER